MPLDPQAQEVINQMKSLNLPPYASVSPAEARENFLKKPRFDGPDVGNVNNLTIHLNGADIPIRIYTPEGTGPFPIVCWFHGGGWVIGNLETADATARELTIGTEAVVISVDYRLAPEAKFPTAFEDCYAVTEWVSHNPSVANIDPTRLAVAGDSAGGNLAAAVCLAARDRKGPSLAFQLLVYPVTSWEFQTNSYLENGEGYLLTLDTMKWFWNHYLTTESDASNPYAAPLAAKDLSNLPPALVITAEFDPLRDEGEIYAERLLAAGVSTNCIRYDGMIHGFFSMDSVIDKGKQAVAAASTALKKALAYKQ